MQSFGSLQGRLQGWDDFAIEPCSHRMAVMPEPRTAVLCQGSWGPPRAGRTMGSPWPWG